MLMQCCWCSTNSFSVFTFLWMHFRSVVFLTSTLAWGAPHLRSVIVLASLLQVPAAFMKGLLSRPPYSKAGLRVRGGSIFPYIYIKDQSIFYMSLIKRTPVFWKSLGDFLCGFGWFFLGCDGISLGHIQELINLLFIFVIPSIFSLIHHFLSLLN